MSNTISFKRGDTWRLTFKYQDDSGNPIDLTGVDVRLNVRTKRGVLLLELDNNLIGGLTVNGLAGEIALEATPAQTELMTVGSHFSDLEVTYTDGSVQSSQTFSVDIIEDITRDES